MLIPKEDRKLIHRHLLQGMLQLLKGDQSLIRNGERDEYWTRQQGTRTSASATKKGYFETSFRITMTNCI
ncbi:unnamed protein product [Kuraishia capsulata CBS 1993]|uniref:Uncharacterized protein n=1 Tax=Kuraishia capsulata CBS 1993 TaxID=1382522 RepID=W6MSD8_9ASCO|nr:uncharacterized protein KUCA_T00005709001 [Kuraishia capsulata CBS 1993]CDK29716.1 unnamed protein product [Kuraishia capsulata CBS 1993]